MPTTEQANEVFSIDGITAFEEFDFLQNSESDLTIADNAIWSGPSAVKMTLAAVAMIAAFTISSTAIGASVGPSRAPTIATTQAADSIAGDLSARIERAEREEARSPTLTTAPSKAFALARGWTRRLASDLSTRNTIRWESPSIAVNAFGEVVFEWWRGNRTLAVYFDGSDPVRFVKSPGPDVEKMEDGNIETAKDFSDLLAWLLTRQA
jgi:hypothetical protein